MKPKSTGRWACELSNIIPFNYPDQNYAQKLKLDLKNNGGWDILILLYFVVALKRIARKANTAKKENRAQAGWGLAPGAVEWHPPATGISLYYPFTYSVGSQKIVEGIKWLKFIKWFPGLVTKLHRGIEPWYHLPPETFWQLVSHKGFWIGTLDEVSRRGDTLHVPGKLLILAILYPFGTHSFMIIINRNPKVPGWAKHSMDQTGGRRVPERNCCKHQTLMKRTFKWFKDLQGHPTVSSPKRCWR